MAKPRVFVSSTYYDLKHIRNSLKSFIENMGYEPVLFESGDIPFRHDIPIDESCYGEITNCHMLVLIIGGRFGSPTSELGESTTKLTDKQYKHYNSITQKEYEKARSRDIPIFIFVDKNVLSEYDTYKQNRDNATTKYVHVDSINIFRLLDDIFSQRQNNYVKGFEKLDDISSWLRDQWAGLFADYLARKSNETALKDLASQVSQLGNVTSVLKEYTESIMKTVQPDESKSIIEREEKKLQQTMIALFTEEPLIDYVLKRHKQDPTKLYHLMETTGNFSEFLKLSGISANAFDELLASNRANADFGKIRQKYFNTNLQP